MSKLQIVYKQDTDQFRTDPEGDFSCIRFNQVGLHGLKSNYDKLRSKINIPSNVGIVTFPICTRSLCKSIPPVEGSATNHRLLAVLENILELEKEPQDSFIDTEFVYRQMGVLMHHRAITWDEDFFNKYLILFAHVSCSPAAKRVFNEVIQTFDGIDEDTPQLNKILATARKMIETYPSFKDVGVVKEKIEAQFKRNKVSKEFPLFYLPTCLKYEPLSFFLFDLTEKLVYSPMDKVLIEWLKTYHEHDSAFDSLRKETEKKKGLVFGETQVRKSLDDLLRDLPEPKTILTDIYPSDNCPELLEREFEAFEFNLNSQPSSPSQ